MTEKVTSVLIRCVQTAVRQQGCRQVADLQAGGEGRSSRVGVSLARYRLACGNVGSLGTAGLAGTVLLGARKPVESV
jgi:hypothetical protein